jgi:hypothetical protein
VGSQRLTAWAMARPLPNGLMSISCLFSVKSQWALGYIQLWSKVHVFTYCSTDTGKNKYLRLNCSTWLSVFCYQKFDFTCISGCGHSTIERYIP